MFGRKRADTEPKNVPWEQYSSKVVVPHDPARPCQWSRQ